MKLQKIQKLDKKSYLSVHLSDSIRISLKFSFNLNIPAC